MDDHASDTSKAKYISPLGAWALCYGCCVGWGAFVMPGTTLLTTAGPVGTVIGMAAGVVLMLVIAWNYRYMMLRFPDEGGAYSYVKSAFGYDHAYLCAWFLVLTYIAIGWANATAIVLIARNLAGPLFQVGFHYQVIGYDIWLGEVFVTIAALVICGLLVIFSKKIALGLQSIMALILVAGIVVCFIAAMTGRTPQSTIAPYFMPGQSPAAEVIFIVALVPWAFVGFESISHSAAELRFPVKKTFGIMALACIACGLSYALPAVIAAARIPEGYDNWMRYLADVPSLSGLQGMPVLYAAGTALGTYGPVFLTVVILCATLTSLIGNFTAASRLIYAMAKDDILPARYARIGRHGTPDKALLLIMGVSCLIPFLGRTAIGWIVDVTTIGATITYGYTSAASCKYAKEEGNQRMMRTGIAGIVMSVLFSLFLLAPDILSVTSLATESYLIFTAWGLIGFIYFRIIFGRDKERRYGKTMFVWIALLLVLLFSSYMWMRKATGEVIAEFAESADAFTKISRALADNSLIWVLLIILSLAILFSIYAVMRERERRLEMEKMQAEEMNEAKSTFLSNMSHEIRTPINAVLGMNEMIIREAAKEERSAESLHAITGYARNVESAGKSLLSIINDILDFSKIEAGKMEVVPAAYKLSSVLNDVTNMVMFRARDKHLAFHVDVDKTLPDDLCGDEVRVRQVVTNVLTNAVKYTQEGSVSFSVSGEKMSDDRIRLSFKVQDTGIGIKEEDIGRLFTQFERMDLNQNKTVEGTGLGLAITRNLLHLMDGDIAVESVYGKGSTFTVTLPQTVVTWDAIGDFREKFERAMQEKALYHESFRAPEAHILVVDDTEMNLTVVKGLLEKTEVRIDTASGGAEAVRLAKETPYDLILMDQRMPQMDGTEALERIRAQEDGANRTTPVLCLTADAVSGAREKYLAQGFDGYLSKPVEGDALEKALIRYLPEDKVERVSARETQAGADTSSAAESAGGPSALQRFYDTAEALDYAEAVRLCGSETVLAKTLKQFYDGIDAGADAIAQYLADKDLRNYTVKVHALKSSARLIGADALSEQARVLEENGNEALEGQESGRGDAVMTELTEKTHTLLESYRALQGTLSSLYTETDAAQPDAPLFTEAQWGQLLTSIRDAAELFDSDTIDDLLADAGTYRMPETYADAFRQLGQAASAMDWETLEKHLDLW